MSHYHEINFNHTHGAEFFKEYQSNFLGIQTELKERDEIYQIAIEVPSFTKGDLSIDLVENKLLRIYGEKETDRLRTIRKEYNIHKGNPEKIECTVVNGMLYINIAKKEEFIPKKIEIKN